MPSDATTFGLSVLTVVGGLGLYLLRLHLLERRLRRRQASLASLATTPKKA